MFSTFFFWKNNWSCGILVSDVFGKLWELLYILVTSHWRTAGFSHAAAPPDFKCPSMFCSSVRILLFILDQFIIPLYLNSKSVMCRLNYLSKLVTKYIILKKLQLCGFRFFSYWVIIRYIAKIKVISNKLLNLIWVKWQIFINLHVCIII